MRLFATCLLSLGLVVSPAMADGTPDKDSADAAKKTASEKANDAAKKAKPDSTTTFETELQKLREEVAQQRAELNRERQKVQALEQRLGMTEAAAPAAETPGTPAAPASAAGGALATPALRSAAAQERPKESPLSFRIGGADFTPGGFVDFENIFRTTNTGNVTATSFWAIPYSNTVAGHLTEFRTTGQYSRFNLKTHGVYGKNDITGYLEFDFNGNDAASVFVSSNSHTDRMRVYYLQLKRDKWEFVGGSSWGLLTPRRTGISPTPSDLLLTYGEDAQVHVGVNYTRAGTFWAGYHFNENWVLAAGIENPQQFIGQGNEAIFPSAFNAALGGQFDNAAVPGTPNAYPDIVAKLAYDNNYSGRRFHFELGGLFTSPKVAVVPTVLGANFQSHSKMGGGVQGDVVADLYNANGKNFRVVANGMWGPGVGRYLIGMGPQAVVHPIVASGAAACGPGAAGGCDVDISMVHAGNLLLGVEFAPNPKSQFGVYYGGAYFQRNFWPDLTVAPNAGGFRPLIGFGFPSVLNPAGVTQFAGSTNINNRAIQEGTFDWTQTLWKNPQYGALLLVTQTSYVTRAPWFVATGAPKNAHLVMGYVSVRYVLP
jgi:hypothetical protein